MKFLFKLFGISLLVLAAGALLFAIQYRGLKKDYDNFKLRHDFD